MRLTKKMKKKKNKILKPISLETFVENRPVHVPCETDGNLQQKKIIHCGNPTDRIPHCISHVDVDRSMCLDTYRFNRIDRNFMLRFAFVHNIIITLMDRQ